jgi:hypothetical protein
MKLKQSHPHQHQKRIKYLGINLTKKMQDLSNKNYKMLLKDMKKDSNEKTTLVHRWEDLMLLKWQ